MNAVIHADTEKNGAAGTVSALASQILIHAEGRDKAMDTVSKGKLNDYDDVTEKVICKLTALTDLFQFFEYTNGKTDFRIKTPAGLFYLLDDCIDDLEGLKK